jgi:Rab GDP dissociation inhibitor
MCTHWSWLTLSYILMQAFARLSAVYGGTYMLHKADAAVVYDESGRAVGVSSEGETAKCKYVVGDPSYFAGKTRPTSRVVRAVCILSHPLPSTDNAHSVQIILPQKQVGRRSGACAVCRCSCGPLGWALCVVRLAG